MRAVDVTSWRRDSQPDGSIVLTARPVHPGFAHEQHAQLRIRRGLPIVRLADDVERFVTQSGEYGALHVERGADNQVRITGSVIGDGEMMTVEGLAESPNMVALVKDLLVQCVWLGASERIRMVPYRPPAGWFGARRDLATVWLPPDAPRDPASLVVGDAVPRGPAERTHALVWPLDPPADTERVGLDGTVIPGTVATWSNDGRVYATAELVSAQWCIRIGLRAGTEQQLVVLRDLARSIEVPPVPANPAPASTELHRWM